MQQCHKLVATLHVTSLWLASYLEFLPFDHNAVLRI